MKRKFEHFEAAMVSVIKKSTKERREGSLSPLFVHSDKT